MLMDERDFGDEHQDTSARERRLRAELQNAYDITKTLTAERDEARAEIVRLNAECTRLACRNAVLTLELDRVNAGTVRLKQDIELSIRRALYAGEG